MRRWGRHNGIYVASSTLAQIKLVPFNASSVWKEPIGWNIMIKNTLNLLVIIKLNMRLKLSLV